MNIEKIKLGLTSDGGEYGYLYDTDNRIIVSEYLTALPFDEEPQPFMEYARIDDDYVVKPPLPQVRLQPVNKHAGVYNYG